MKSSFFTEFSPFKNQERYFVGMYDPDQIFRFHWLDGRRYDANVLWKHGNPADLWQCVAMGPMNRYFYVDCSSKLGYICMKPKGKQVNFYGTIGTNSSYCM